MLTYYTKAELEEMLEASQHDFDMWKKTEKLAYLRDASNKLVAIGENTVANKIGKQITNWGEFMGNFHKLSTNKLMKAYIKDLHIFFYEGLHYDETVKEVEYKYNKVKKFFLNVIKKKHVGVPVHNVKYGMGKHQTITACAFLVKNGKLLLAKRAATQKFLPNKYELIGGHVEFGENPEEALKREAMEEMEIDIEIGVPFYAFTYVRNEDDHCIEVDYFAHLKDPKQQIKLHPEDHSGYVWIEEVEMPNYLDVNDAELKAVEAGFKTLRNLKGV